ncbi:hypothetical protein [Sporosalibacterium faouarense]|uniref:hypothetical protein n=1 Tax=Sporosalibacterium faouarense TaxID=516123 RepID=UPI00192C5A84|nr:hypothetical protein [Sporosalibacterium faouarense]
MQYKKTISILVLIIVVLSLMTSIIGVFSSKGKEENKFVSIHGESIEIYGKGIYKNDSVSVAAQGKAQDIITIIVGIPLLFISLYMYRKNSLKGKLLLTGTLGYFLYTYISYVFLWMYNPLFLVYVILMSTSFFAFTLSMISFDFKNISTYFSEKLPVKFIGGVQIFLAIMLIFMWLGRIVPSVIDKTTPPGLEHYTTLVIQGMDLGFIVPIAFISGVLIIKRKIFGYLLSSVIIMKGFTMGAAITAMIVGQYLAGVEMSIVEVIIFPIISLVIAYSLVLILKNIDEKKEFSLL